MTKLNLWDAWKPTMIFQRVYCVSPLQRVGNLFEPSLTSSIYWLVSGILYYALLVYSAYRTLCCSISEKLTLGIFRRIYQFGMHCSIVLESNLRYWRVYRCKNDFHMEIKYQSWYVKNIAMFHVLITDCSNLSYIVVIGMGSPLSDCNKFAFLDINTNKFVVK